MLQKSKAWEMSKHLPRFEFRDVITHEKPYCFLCLAGIYIHE